MTNSMNKTLRTGNTNNALNGTHVVTLSSSTLTIDGGDVLEVTDGIRGRVHGVAVIDGAEVTITTYASIEAARVELAARRADTARRVAWVESLDL